jgi:hypothetical protein
MQRPFSEVPHSRAMRIHSQQRNTATAALLHESMNVQLGLTTPGSDDSDGNAALCNHGAPPRTPASAQRWPWRTWISGVVIPSVVTQRLSGT